jgi:hypothetical protein
MGIPQYLPCYKAVNLFCRIPQTNILRQAPVRSCLACRSSPLFLDKLFLWRCCGRKAIDVLGSNRLLYLYYLCAVLPRKAKQPCRPRIHHLSGPASCCCTCTTPGNRTLNFHSRKSASCCCRCIEISAANAT